MRKSWTIAFVSLTAILLFFTVNPAVSQESQRQKPEQNPQENSYRDQTQDTYHDQSQKDSGSYPGKVTEKFGKYYLEDERKHTSFQLQGTWDAKRFVGKKVRITGALDTEKNILHVIAIALTP
jgi:YbbR domain-containing protein